MRLLGPFGCLIVVVCGVSLVGCGGSPDPAPAADSSTSADPTTPPGPGEMDPAAMESPEMGSEEMMAGEQGMSPAAMPGDAGGGEDAYMNSEMEASAAMGSSAAMEEAYMTGGEAMYPGGAMGMPGGGRPAAGDPLAANLSRGVQTQLAERLLTAVQAASSTKTAEKTPTMRDRANEAFVGSDEALALRFLYAHMVSEYDQAIGTFGSVSFSPALREPVWWLRWGVSLHVRADDLEAPHPIVKGMSSPLPERSATRGGYGNRGRTGASPRGASPAAAPGMEGMEGMGMEGMEGMGMGGSQPRSSSPGAPGVSPQVDETLYKSLGLISEQVGAQLDTRFQNGSFGRGFQGVEVAPAAAPLPRSMRVDQRTGERIQEPSMSSDAQYEMAASGMPPGSMQEPGAVAMSGGMEESEMMMMESMQGQPGMPGPGPGVGGPGAGRPGAAGAAAPAAPTFQPDLPRWRPGLAFLGELPLTESLEKAQENGLQFVLHFDVVVQGKKTRTIIRVVNVADGDTVVASKKLDNVECYKLVEAERTTEAEYVAEVVAPMFEVVEEKLSVVPMPKLTSQQALGRVAALLESAPDFDWHSMAELRLFQSQGLLDEEQVSAAMHLFGGDDALVLLYGLPAERREIVSRRLDE
ncbi:hypothetical protein [Roseimaritima ulvae]|uniref:Uncharacterized protein n=1 Tax=Roseimaritima ulvae TaxID=980254 RepID=A0A5B9QWC8_9BACT|nr:hypothetical protein [Roseimaritima ulvae]QEG42292.1 hypothetical protein UC8_43260 [Roseimaritima ulvae]